MRRKTYLTPERQLDLTLSFVLGAWRRGGYAPMFNSGWFYGIIVLHHRLFRKGDIVLVRVSNGQAERQPVWGVSSKGSRVCGLFMQYARYRGLERFDAGPLRFIGLPAHLEEGLPDAPAAKMHLLQLRLQALRTGNAADG